MFQCFLRLLFSYLGGLIINWLQYTSHILIGLPAKINIGLTSEQSFQIVELGQFYQLFVFSLPMSAPHHHHSLKCSHVTSDQEQDAKDSQDKNRNLQTTHKPIFKSSESVVQNCSQQNSLPILQVASINTKMEEQFVDYDYFSPNYEGDEIAENHIRDYDSASQSQILKEHCSGNGEGKKFRKYAENFLINCQNNERFCYRIWGRHKLLSNVSDFGNLFTQIKEQTMLKSINLQFKQLLPNNYKGAIFNLHDLDQIKLYYSSIILIKYLNQLEHRLLPYEQSLPSVMLLLPRMQVPVMMGKEGKLIGRIKKITRTNVVVYGPYQEYLYQTVEISGNCIEDIAKACFLIYSTVWKVLKRQPIIINNMQSMMKNVRIGIEISQKFKSTIINPYQSYLDSLIAELKIETQIKPSPKPGSIIINCEGQVAKLKLFLISLLELAEFENLLPPVLKIIITTEQSKILTSHNGKFLRDLSNKCQDCYMEVIAKDCWDGQSKLIIKGQVSSRLQIVSCIIEFLAVKNQIISNQRSLKPIQYEKQLEDQIQLFNDGQILMEKNQKNCGSKCKKIKKKKKKPIHRPTKIHIDGFNY